jgi:hypothetical protein
MGWTRTTLIRSALAAAAALLALSCSGSGSGPSTAPSATPACPHNPLLGVYDPPRLEVRTQCVWYRGIVTSVDVKSDGDHHIDITPDDGFDDMLNDGNKKDQDGAMVLELMPGQHIPIPVIGEHVAVFGTLVHDSHNDWNEMHPAWALEDLTTGDRVTSLPPADPLYFKPTKSALVRGCCR